MVPIHRQLTTLSRLGWLALTITLQSALSIAPCLADEGPQLPIHAVSANSIFTLDIDPYHIAPFPVRRYTIRQAGAVIQSGEITTLERDAVINDAGNYFVMYDPYDGVAIYQADGRCINQLTPSDILNPLELYRRPGRWPCHPEGIWTRETSIPLFLPDGKSCSVETYNGHTIVIDLATGQILDHRADVSHFILASAMVLLTLWAFRRSRPV